MSTYRSSPSTYRCRTLPTDQELGQLIQLVKDRPRLYNREHPQYRNPNKDKEEVWNEIAKEMGWSAASCKERWRYIRDSFKRSLKKRKNMLPSSKGSKYEEFALDFLNEHVYKCYPHNNGENSSPATPLEAAKEVSVKVEPPSPTSTATSTTSEDYILPDKIVPTTDDHSSTSGPDQPQAVASVSNPNTKLVVIKRVSSATPTTVTTTTAAQPPFVVVGGTGDSTTTNQQPLVVMADGSIANHQPQIVMVNGLQTAAPQPQQFQQQPFVMVEPTKTSVQNDVQTPPPPVPTKKRKKLELNPDSEHPIDSFFRSMAQTVKQFPPLQIAEVKMEVCRLVTKIECDLLRAEETSDCDSLS